jgi:hypothetical protein
LQKFGAYCYTRSKNSVALRSNFATDSFWPLDDIHKVSSCIELVWLSLMEAF